MSQFRVLPVPAITVTPSGTQDVNLTEVGGAPISEGQKTMANSIPVVIASDQSAIPITASALPLPTGASTSALQTSGNAQLVTIASNQTNGTQVTAINNFPATQPISGTVTANQGTAGGAAWPVSAVQSGTWTNTVTQATAASLNATVVQPSGTNLHVNVDNFPATQPISGTVAVTQSTSPWVENVSQFGGSAVVTGTGASGAGIPRVTVSSDSVIASITNALPAGANLLGKVGIDQTTAGTTNAVSLAQLGTGTINTSNGTAGTGTLRVAIASDNTSNTNPFLVADQKAATSTLTNVASSASSVSILASNAARKGAMIFNDSSATLYLKFGTTASTTSYTVQIAGNGYYEFPAYPGLYTGACDGIWSSATGNARVTELS